MKAMIDSLNWRYATKEFDSNKKLSDVQISTLIEALRLTPSSFGLQPWKFVLVESPELREKLVEASWNQNQVKEASHLIVLCRPLNFSVEKVDRYISDMAQKRGVDLESLKGFRDMMLGFLDRKDEAQVNEWMTKQVYIALGNLMTVCATLKIDSCPMEGFLPSKYSEILNLKERGLYPVLVCPVGYRKESDKYKQAEKVRYSTEEILLRI